MSIEWFETNNIKLNKDKCQLLGSGHTYGNVWVKMGDGKIWESAKQKLLEMEMEEILILMITCFNCVRKREEN